MAQPGRKNNNATAAEAGIDITYFTDPLCCWSWAFEPEWRKLQYEYRGILTWNYSMGGLLPSWQNFVDPINTVNRPVQMGPVWMHASVLSGMPIESNIWMKDPPASSYPACIAVKCAQLQSSAVGEYYLRMLREQLMLQGINIARNEVLLELASVLSQQFSSFDVKLFEHHLFGNAGLEAFKNDIEKSKRYSITRFPTLIFRKKNQQPVMITGYRPYSALVEALKQLSPGIEPTQLITSASEYKSAWPTITQRELEEAFK